jgi:hypothetical protein
MISDKAIAAKLSELMLDLLRRLDDSVAEVMSTCPPAEFTKYRRAAGAVMGEIVLEVLNPLYSSHPSLKPPEIE